VTSSKKFVSLTSFVRQAAAAAALATESLSGHTRSAEMISAIKTLNPD
jgi:hypothetical protein